MSEIPGFSRFEFEHAGITHPVFFRGSGPGVLLMHELPGMVPQCVEFANAIVSQGFTVYLPLLFGKPNAPATTARNTIHVCLSREFRCFAKNESGPVTDWLRAMCVERIRPSCPGRGIGAIGMCFTGGFVLSLFIPDILLAPVTSQPALPFGMTAGLKAALGASQRHLDEAVASGVPVLGFRFEGDRICPAQRFATLTKLLGPRFEAHQLPGDKHSVLTIDFVNDPKHPTFAARERVFAFLKQQL